MRSALYAEDDPSMGALVAFALEDLDIEVEVVPDGLEALQRLRREPRPDVVILDDQLPGMSGVHVLDAIRVDEALRDMPVLIVSARDPATGPTTRFARERTAVLRKPFRLDELTSTIRRLTPRR